jgi:alpha-beta hydrolase superfamily lysophospholipase
MEDAMEKVKAGKVTFPWACVHGTKDLVIDIEGSRTLFQYSSCAARANANSTVLKVKKDSDSDADADADADADVDSNSCSKRAELYVLEGAMHDPLGAPQTPEVIQIMLQWLKNDQLSEK